VSDRPTAASPLLATEDAGCGPLTLVSYMATGTACLSKAGGLGALLRGLGGERVTPNALNERQRRYDESVLVIASRTNACYVAA
jgi:hypothetical protein